MALFHVPAWAWAATIAAVLVMLAADLLADARRGRPVRMHEAAWWTLATIGFAVAFGVLLAVSSGGAPAGQFFAGWLTEYSLSLDNLLVFVILIGRSRVPRQQHGRVLLAGILLALLFRGAVIGLGAAALHKFEWVEYVFGGFLIYTAVQVAAPRRAQAGRAAAGLADGTAPGGVGPSPDGGPAPNGWGPSSGGAPSPETGPLPVLPRGRGTPLLSRLAAGRRLSPVLMLIIALGVTDVMFALDSIPAIFGLTRDPFLVFSANVFALLGLRHLYFLAGGLLARLVYLPAGLAVVLTFIGLKLIAEALRASGVTRLGPVPVPDVSAWLSLTVIIVVLTVTAVASGNATRRRRDSADPARRS